jgi:hypothetical protein
MTLLTLIQTTADELGLTRPSAVVSSTDSQVRQLLALMNRVGEALMTEFPWQRLIKEYTFATVSGTAAYDFPSDFDRPVNQSQWDRTNHWQLDGPISPQEWQFRKGGIVSSGPRSRFRIQGNQVKIDPTPTSVFTVAYEYVSRNWVLAADGSTYKASFTADDDTALFKDRLLILGTKLKFMEIKGMDTTTLARDFTRELSNAQGQDQGAPTLSLARRSRSIFITSDNAPETGFGS